MRLPKFSVVIPCFNNASTFRRAIESVLLQDTSIHEIIVVDDGSTDDTSTVAASFGDTIIYYKQANAGVSAARNQGVSIATGEWIAFLDADDVYTQDRISAHAFLIQQDPVVDFLLADQEARTPDGILLKTFIESTEAGRTLLIDRPAAAQQHLVLDDFEALIADGYMEIRTVSIRRVTFLELAGFPVNHKIGEDFHFFVRLLAISSRGTVVMRPLATYYIYPVSALRKNPLLTQIQFVNCVESLQKHMKDAPPPIVRGWQRKLRACRLSLAYAYLRERRHVAAVRSVLPLLASDPSWRSARDVLSVLKGL